MKKFLFILIFLTTSAFASDKIHLQALQDYNSSNPNETFSAQVLETSVMDNIVLLEGDKINCVLLKIKNPKRAKIDAKVYFQIVSYENPRGLHEISKKLTAKYAKRVLNKEEVINIPPKKVAKTALSIAGGAVVEGFSYGVSFVDGLITNEEGNRLKSGAKQVYDDSFVSYIEYGQDVDIKTGDVFYFIIKSDE